MPAIIPPTPYDDSTVYIDPYKDSVDYPWFSPSKIYHLNDRVKNTVNGKTSIYRRKVNITTPDGSWIPERWAWIADLGSSGSSGSYDYSTKTCKLVLRYNSNGHGDPPPENSVTYSGEKKEITLKRTVRSLSDTMIWTDHYFIGWSESSNASSPDPNYDPGKVVKYTWDASASGTVTKTLYAVWCERGRFVYKPGQFANESSDAWHDRFQKLPDSGSATLRGPIFTRTGYNLVGWLYHSEHFADVNGSVDVSNLSGDINLYPEWEPKTFTITYKSNISNSTQPDIVDSVTYDTEIILRNETSFSKHGYHISQWNEDPDGKKGTWYPGKTYAYTVDKNVTLYAQWAGNEYFVVYCADKDTALSTTVRLNVDSPFLGLDEHNCIVSVSDEYTLTLDSNNVLNMPPSILSLNSPSMLEYSIATYGSPFYTDYRLKNKENYSFAGWETVEGVPLIKMDAWMEAYSLDTTAIWTRTNNLILYPVWSDKYPFGKIFFGRKETSDYGIIINKPPSYSWPSKPYTHNNIKGHNGDIIEDPEYYKNVSKTYSITSYNRDNVYSAATNVSDFLHRYDGYKDYIRLEDSYEPDIYMLGIYEEDDELESILGQAWQTEIKFNCKPQKYLLSGNRKIDVITSGATINNPTNYPAFPLLKIWGTGTIHFLGRPTRTMDSNSGELKNTMLSIYENYNEININSETFDAVDIEGNNMSRAIYLGDRITLYPGINEITYAGDIQKISIIPKWWRL